MGNLLGGWVGGSPDHPRKAEQLPMVTVTQAPGDCVSSLLQIFYAPGIPWTEEPGRLQSMVSQRVGHDCNDSAHVHHLQRIAGGCSKEPNENFFSPLVTKQMLCVIDQNEIIELWAPKIQSCSTHSFRRKD